ncbi:MAG: coproporphyrinogen III oxidase [Syntrophus sp. (in: bacteria)]|nr:coproporphyrinogen III oxidase [Syntrophus sp. (in: bacteria)]
MFIERFIGYTARKKNEDYLKFSPGTSYELPLKKTAKAPLLLYVHIPFCEELCPYCSFHRVAFREDLAKAYFNALKKEIRMYKDQGYDFKALYIGGGTPTVLIDELADTIGLIRTIYDVKEISVETNPNHLSERNMEILKNAGVNRLSVGVQTFDDSLLKATERYHKYGSGGEIAQKLASLRGYFDTLNVDMIFNFPTQKQEMLEQDLSTLLGLQVDQITYYPLMVSSATQKIMGKRLGNVVHDRGREFYETITGVLGQDYRASTAWCFSRDKAMIDEYVINYDEYAGLGSGSIGYLGGSIYANTFDIEDYIKQVEKGQFPISARRDCGLKEKLLYDFLMKLFGLSLDLKELGEKHGVNAAWYLFPEIFFFMMTGGMKKYGNLLILTPKGQYYWVIMMREFFTSVNNFRDHCRSIANLSLAH